MSFQALATPSPSFFFPWVSSSPFFFPFYLSHNDMTDRHEKLAAVPHSAPFEKRQKTSHHLFLALSSAPKNLTIKQTEHIRTYQKKKKKGNQKKQAESLNLYLHANR